MRSGKEKTTVTNLTDAGSAIIGTLEEVDPITGNSIHKKKTRSGKFNLPSIKNIAANWDDKKVSEWNEQSKASIQQILNKYGRKTT